MRAGRTFLFSALGLSLLSCGGGGGSSTTAPVSTPPPAPVVNKYSVPAAESLSISDVETIIAQAVSEAGAQNISATIAITDRVGNVLAVFRMSGAGATTVLRKGKVSDNGLQGVSVPQSLAAIAKAITGAYLSSGGNAFTTRTASQIIQEHFPPSANAVGLEGGPLFGVQFSQLPCSDLMERFGVTIGPKRSPLGLAADPGGLPLYKNGALVGGIGIEADGDYGFDTETNDTDRSVEELTAIAGAFGFAAPLNIRAERVSVDGTTLRFTDLDESDLASDPAGAPAFSTLTASVGTLVPVRGYTAAAPAIIAGETYQSEASGIRPSSAAEFANRDIFVLSNGAGVNRYPPIAATDGADVTFPLTATEVDRIANEAFDIMTRSRAQIRRPLDSRAQVSISIVDTYGTILAVIRSPDAPIFGIDVSLQKARTATFFSNRVAASDLLATTRNPVLAGPAVPAPRVNDRVATVRAFLNLPIDQVETCRAPISRTVKSVRPTAHSPSP